MGCSIYKRIQSVRLSLENAEQSFLDNKDMRGELDLMLAEAELKNLRRKQKFPWSWNRQLLALCIAALVAAAGAGGWYYAHFYGMESAAAAKNKTAITVVENKSAEKCDNIIKEDKIVVLPQAGEMNINNNPLDTVQEKPVQKQLADVDIRQLVHSARVELSSSN